MALSDITKVKIRDHLGYGVAGLPSISPVGGSTAIGQIGYRFFKAYGQLEYRLNNMSPNEEAMLTGAAVGAVGILGVPTAGDVFRLFVSGGGLSTPSEILVTAQAGNQNFNIAAALANGVNADDGCQLAMIRGVGLYGTGPFSPNTTVPLPEVAIFAPETFQLTVRFTSSASAQITNQGSMIGPQASIDGQTLLTGYVPICDALKGAIASASQNFDTAQADVWKGRSSELALRISAYEAFRRQMQSFLGPDVGLGPGARQQFKASGFLKHT